MRLILPNGNFIQSEYNHVVMYNHLLGRYEIETMERVAKESDCMNRDRKWVIVEVFHTRKQAVDYVEKNR